MWLLRIYLFSDYKLCYEFTAVLLWRIFFGMNKLLLYGVLHGNLNYSYIPEDLYPQIINRCYWPFLDIMEAVKIPFGVELSAYSLEIVNQLDPLFVKKLKSLCDEGGCEFVGSGYMQAIMPMIPVEVNRENLAFGNRIYEKLLGRCPTIAYVNEQVYSKGIPSLYRDAGYEALMINWESAFSSHEDSELLYQPCAVSAGTDDEISIIWQSHRGYRDFQRYVETEISIDEYLTRLGKHIPERVCRTYPIYTSDW